MKCRHARVYRKWRWYGQWLRWTAASKLRLPWDAYDARVCFDCNTWLPLGPSNDEPEAVKIEIRAAEIAAKWAPLDREQIEVWDGWYCHRDGVAPNADTPSEYAGYLAREIATHDERGAR